MKKLILYYFPACPYCQTVLEFINEHKLEVELRNTREKQEYAEELHGMTGKSQVPCLSIDGKPLLESREIVHYLANRAQEMRTEQMKKEKEGL